MKYTVLIFPTADADLSEIRTYFEEEFKISSDNLFDKFFDSLRSIEENPYIRPLVKDITLAGKGYRFVPVDNYLIFYVIVGNDIQIHRILFGKRYYSNLL